MIDNPNPNDLLKELLQAQVELIEATKLEATQHEKKSQDYQKLSEATNLEALNHEKMTQEYSRLCEAEKETAKLVAVNNEIMQKRLDIAEEILEILKANIEEKAIERELGKLIVILSGIKIISEHVAYELLKRVYTEPSSLKEREDLLNALINIGASKSTLESKINLISDRDITTRDIKSS